MSSCLYSTIFTNRGTRRTLCVHEKNDDDDDDDDESRFQIRVKIVYLLRSVPCDTPNE